MCNMPDLNFVVAHARDVATKVNSEVMGGKANSISFVMCLKTKHKGDLLSIISRLCINSGSLMLLFV